MSLFKRFLSQDYLSKYEKEQKKRYKQYVKVRISNTITVSKPESEIYQDYLTRKKSLRRSKRKTSAPKRDDKNDIFKEPSTSGTLTAAPAVLDAINKNVTVNHMPVEYLNDLKQMEGMKVEVNTNMNNNITKVPAQELQKESTQSNDIKTIQIDHELNSSVDIGNTQPLEQKFSYGNQDKFLDQLDEIIKNRNRNQPSPSVSVSSQNHIYENAPNLQENINVPIVKPRKKATKRKNEDKGNTEQSEDVIPETNDSRPNSFDVQNRFVPIEVQEKLNEEEEVLSQSHRDQGMSSNFNQVEVGEEFGVTLSQDNVERIPDPNRKKRNDSENYQAEHEELTWSTITLNSNVPERTRTESCITTQSEDSFFDCVSDNGDIYDDEEKNIMKQISPHFNKTKFSNNDGSETDSKSIDSVRILNQRKQISLDPYEEDFSDYDMPKENPRPIDFVKEDQIPSRLQEEKFNYDDTPETDFRSINSEDQIAQDMNKVSQQVVTFLNDDRQQKQDLLMEFESLTMDDVNLSMDESEDNIEPDSLEIPPKPVRKNIYVEAHNDYVKTDAGEAQQVKESDFASEEQSKEKLHEFEEAQTQNEALFLDDNYRATQPVSNFRDDPEFLQTNYNQRLNKNNLIKLENNNDYDDVEPDQEKHEGKKVTFDFGKSYCQTYEVDSSPEESELIDSTLISALTKEEGQVFMPIDNELYMRMQQNGRNKLTLNTHHDNTEHPQDERSQVFQSYGVQLTPEEEMIENIFENSKNMDVAFLNCVDGFDINIQQQKEPPNSENIDDEIQRQPDTELNKPFINEEGNSSNTKMQDNLPEESAVQSRKLKKPIPPPRVRYNTEEDVKTFNTDKNISADFTDASVKHKILNETLVEDQPPESLQLVDFAEDNRDIDTKNENDQQLLQGPKSLLLVDNDQVKEPDRRSSILDEPTPISNTEVEPINITCIPEGNKVKTRSISNELFNEWHVSVENFDHGQIAPSNDTNRFGNYNSIHEDKRNKLNVNEYVENYDGPNNIVQHDYNTKNVQENSTIQQLIPLDYVIDNADDNSEKVMENNQGNNEKLLPILETSLEQLENHTLEDAVNLTNIKETPAVEEETFSQSPLENQNAGINVNNNENDKDTAPISNTSNKIEVFMVEDSLANVKNVPTNITNESEDLETIIEAKSPISPLRKNLSSPFSKRYVPGRRSIDFSQEITSPPPTPQSKLFNRSVSHNFFPPNRSRPKPVQFDRFKNKLPHQQVEDTLVSNNNNPVLAKRENTNETVAEIQERLTRVSKMDDAGEQLVVMQDIVVSLRKKADSLNSRNDVEYLPLLQSLFKSVRVVSTFQCNFDEILLASQQDTLKDVKKCISELSLK